MRVIAFRTAVLAWVVGMLGTAAGYVPLLLLALALFAVGIGAFVLAVIPGSEA